MQHLSEKEKKEEDRSFSEKRTSAVERLRVLVRKIALVPFLRNRRCRESKLLGSAISWEFNECIRDALEAKHEIYATIFVENGEFIDNCAIDLLPSFPPPYRLL